MSADVEFPPEQTVASLVSGILDDLKHLVEQQLRLTRRELELELRRQAAAAVVFMLGAATLFLTVPALCLTSAHLLHWAAAPPETDRAWLPLWACHAVVTAALAVVGAVLLQIGRARYRALAARRNRVPQVLREDVRWTTTPK